MTAQHTITIRQDGARFTVRIDIPAIPRQHFADQPAAEHFADGLALGLRLVGRTVRIDIDVPKECGGVLEYEALCGMRVMRNGRFRSRCPKCGEGRDSTRSNLICDAVAKSSEQDEDPDDEPIDFAMLDTPDTARPAKAATAPARDPVEVRLERENMSHFYRLADLERGRL